VVAKMELWISGRNACHFIAVTGMHGVTEAQHEPSFKQILNAASLVVPDGMPLVWLGRRQGFHLKRRVYGRDRFEVPAQMHTLRPGEMIHERRNHHWFCRTRGF